MFMLQSTLLSFIVVLPYLVLGKTSHFGSDIYNNVYNIIL